MSKLSKKGLFGIAVVLSAVLAVLVYRYLSTPIQGQAVMVAKTNIPPKTVITESMVKEISVPKDYIQPNAIQEKTKVIGAVAKELIVAEGQITARQLALSGKPAGFTGVIPAGKRAMTLAVTDESGVAGFTKPGDYVDVIVTLNQQLVGESSSKIILRNIQVLAANRETEEDTNAAVSNVKSSNPAKTTTVTLAVDPMEALQLAMSDDIGKVRLMLRPYMPTDDTNITAIVTPRDLLGGQLSLTTNNQPAQVASYYTPDENYYQPQTSADSKSNNNGSTIQMIRGTKSETISFN